MNAIGIGTGDEVIVPAITFVATGNCVFHQGGTPVIADVNPHTGLLDPDDFARKITPRTRAVIPVQLTGASCDMESMAQIAQHHGIRIVEDACHALGGEYSGGKICGCRYSDMAITSFHPVKSITTGEGGAVFTNDQQLDSRIRSYRNHGITKDPVYLNEDHGPWYYEMQGFGTNARLTDFQCALGQIQIKRLDEFISRRRDIAAYYNQQFEHLPGIITPLNNRNSAWHLYVVRVNPEILGADRLEVFHRLKNAGLGINVHYIPLHFQPYYQKHLGVIPGDFPGAETYYWNAISLPIYPSMSDLDVDRTVETVQSIVYTLARSLLHEVS
jgi:dTDP-4-amino-4,6-dideoxygalactose transaminase